MTSLICSALAARCFTPQMRRNCAELIDEVNGSSYATLRVCTARAALIARVNGLESWIRPAVTDFTRPQDWHGSGIELHACGVCMER